MVEPTWFGGLTPFAMTDYDDLFDEVATTDSVFADKGALDPLAEPDEVVAREDEERQLAAILTGVHEGYLPATVEIHGPPGTGKTLTTRRMCREFAKRTAQFDYEYVNLKECRSIFSVANEILRELTGERKPSNEGVDGVFEAIWDALEAYPEYVVLILDEIDHIAHDSNYDPNDFFYRLLRGEGKMARGLNLSAFLVSNEVLEVDLRLDSRVENVISGEEVFFGHYTAAELTEIATPRVARAFRAGALGQDTMHYAIVTAANRWGDARRTLTLFRQAGETANEEGWERINKACIDANIETTEKEATLEKLSCLPTTHFRILKGITGWSDWQTDAIIEPVTTEKVQEWLQESSLHANSQVGMRTIRNVITDLETMGLVETWIESRGREGRVKQIETTFDPQWMREAERQTEASDSPES